MGFIRGAGVFFLSSLLVISIIAVSLALTLNTFLYPEIYLDAFEKGGVYEYISDNLDNSQAATFIEIPQGGPRALITPILTNFLAYLRSDTDVLNITVKVDTQKLRNFFLEGVNNLTVCTPNQNPFNQEKPCLPSGQTPEEFLDEFLEERNLSFFEKDVVDLTGVYALEEGSKGRNALEKARNIIQDYQLSLWIAGMIIVILCAGIYLLKRPDTKGFYRSIGVTFCIAGISLILLIILFKTIPQSMNYTDTMLKAVILSITSAIYARLVWSAIPYMLIGITLLIISFVIKKDTDKRQEK